MEPFNIPLPRKMCARSVWSRGEVARLEAVFLHTESFRNALGPVNLYTDDDGVYTDDDGDGDSYDPAILARYEQVWFGWVLLRQHYTIVLSWAKRANFPDRAIRGFGVIPSHAQLAEDSIFVKDPVPRDVLAALYRDMEGYVPRIPPGGKPRDLEPEGRARRRMFRGLRDCIVLDLAYEFHVAPTQVEVESALRASFGGRLNDDLRSVFVLARQKVFEGLPDVPLSRSKSDGPTRRGKSRRKHGMAACPGPAECEVVEDLPESATESSVALCGAESWDCRADYGFRASQWEHGPGFAEWGGNLFSAPIDKVSVAPTFSASKSSSASSWAWPCGSW